MKALSLWQPWASLLVAGVKQIETRSWPIRHRGPLLIHAASHWTRAEDEICRREPFASALAGLRVQWTPGERRNFRRPALPFGAIVGRVDVVDCFPTELVTVSRVIRHCWMAEDGPAGRGLAIPEREAPYGNYDPGRFAFACRDPVRFDTPVYCRGHQGLFEVPDGLLAGRATS